MSKSPDRETGSRKLDGLHMRETVAAGEVLIIIEAMKMENEIRSPIDGLLVSMLVKEGDAVTAGTSLCSVAVVKG
jgi:biotin carboxyl carrier protein